MSYPMPTIVGKGEILVRLDNQYRNAERRLASLRRLVWDYPDIVDSGTQGITPGGDPLLDADDEKHMDDDWFATSSNWWNVLTKWLELPSGIELWKNGTLDATQIQQSRECLRLGFIRALAVSLGLTEDILGLPQDEFPDDTSGLDDDKIRPVKVYWVCGKLDGIEVQVVESDEQIDLFLVTPPIKAAVEGLCWIFSDDQIKENNKANEGMVLISYSEVEGKAVVRHVALEDGGIAKDAENMCERRSFGVTNRNFPTRALPEIPADLLGRMQELAGVEDPADHIAELIKHELDEFTVGLNARQLWLTDVGVSGSSIFAEGLVQGHHFGTFLGWAATGEEVVFKVAARGAKSEDESETFELKTLEWDRLSLHGKLGVRAVGRPIRPRLAAS